MRTSFQPHVSESIRALNPYVPGKPIDETKREFGLKKVIKLASNENPLGPSRLALKAIQKNLVELHRYPDASAHELKAALAQFWKLESNQFVIGNGSNEIIDLLIRTFCQPGDCIATPFASFIAYQICAQIHGVKTVQTQVDSKFVADLDALLKVVETSKNLKLVFLANPNNPTGTFVQKKDLYHFLEKTRGKVIVALDYAYWEYVTSSQIPSPAEIVSKFDHVVVMNTFSKAYGLAGLRVGYGVGSSKLLTWIERVRQPFNFSSIALVGAIAALKDKKHVTDSRKLNHTGMKFWEKSFKELDIPFIFSQGNFILINSYQACARYGGDMFQACLKHGVIFRPVTNYDLAEYLRISIGTMVENKFALKALKTEILKARKPSIQINIKR